MKPAAHIFRQYDIRGIVGEELNADVARDVGRAFGTRLREAVTDRTPRVVVGRDNRPTSPALAAALLDGHVRAVEPTAGEPRIGSAHRTRVDRQLACASLGRDARRAVVAVARPVADARHAARAQGVEVALVEREVGAAEGARRCASVAGRPARAAPHDVGVVRPRDRDLHRLAARAPEPRPGLQAPGVELAGAGGTGDEHAHGLIRVTRPVRPGLRRGRVGGCPAILCGGFVADAFAHDH